jgi:hypothetical protein
LGGFLYGLIRAKDAMLWAPNLAGLALSSAQLVLFAVYFTAKEREGGKETIDYSQITTAELDEGASPFHDDELAPTAAARGDGEMARGDANLGKDCSSSQQKGTEQYSVDSTAQLKAKIGPAQHSTAQ